MMKRLYITSIVCVLLLISCNKQTAKTNYAETPNQKTTSQKQIIDLTHEFSEETIYWVTAKEFELDVVANGQTDNGYFYSANNFATAEHGGTHIDAPIHFAKDGQTVDQIPLKHIIGHAIKIDVSEKTLHNPDYLISIEDFTNWETQEGMKIPDASIVLLETGFSKFYPDKTKYLGTDARGPEALKDLHFPGLSPQAAQWLVDNRYVHAIGIDTPSIDYGQSTLFESHVTLMTKNIPAFENVANLNQLPTKGFEIIALPMKIKGGSGGPLRIIAILNHDKF